MVEVVVHGEDLLEDLLLEDIHVDMVIMADLDVT
jgi:hypothetical protein